MEQDKHIEWIRPETILPHRGEMLLIDRFYRDEDGIGHAIYQTAADAPFLVRGLVPGSFLCEMMAQGSAIVVAPDLEGKSTMYTGIRHMEFYQEVRGGALCEMTGRLIDRKSGLYYAEVSLSVDGSLCARGDISLFLLPRG